MAAEGERVFGYAGQMVTPRTHGLGGELSYGRADAELMDSRRSSEEGVERGENSTPWNCPFRLLHTAIEGIHQGIH